MALPLFIARDTQSIGTNGSQMIRNFSNNITRFEMTANVVFSTTVPTDQGAKLVAYFNFNKAADVFVQPGSSPVLAYPTGTEDHDPSELNPIGRIVTAGETLQFLTSTANVFVTISYFTTLA